MTILTNFLIDRLYLFLSLERSKVQTNARPSFLLDYFFADDFLRWRNPNSAASSRSRGTEITIGCEMAMIH